MNVQNDNQPADRADPADVRTAEGFAAAAESLMRLLYAVSYAILQNSDACADAVQSALLKAWENRGRVREPAAFPGYLVRIVQNECRDQLRKRRRCGPLPPDAAAAPDERGTRIDVRGALAKLSEQDRSIAMLYYFERYPAEQIAGLLHLPRGTVHSRLFRIREKLRKELHGYEQDER